MTAEPLPSEQQPQPLPSSFRDPSGYMARVDGELVRVIQPCYRENFDLLHRSGLYQKLIDARLLVSHTEVDASLAQGAFKVLRPRNIPFISYPYEWCFSQWRDAAVATLRIQELAVGCGMTLKDASAFNIQFVENNPILIDLLSFEKLEPKPWVAYGQFCRHFLAPLALMSFLDGRLGQLLREHLDGVPLDLASKLLPLRTRLRPSLALHLHLHAASQRWLTKTAEQKPAGQENYSSRSLLGLVHTLRSAIEHLSYKPRRDVWANYYTETITGGGYLEKKQRVLAAWLDQGAAGSVWDLGANTGLFSRIAAERGCETVAFDGDIDCVELTYRGLREKPVRGLLPLYLDLANPSPGLGWAHRERMPWLQRPEPNLVLALALIHHLAIGNNVPLARLAEFFASFSPRLIIEFVPKDDPNARKLLHFRRDIFDHYTRENFETEFRSWFDIDRAEPMAGSQRVLYLMSRRRQPTVT